MSWYIKRGYDRKRVHRALTDICKRRLGASMIWRQLCSKSGTELDRLALADVCEEEGEAVVARVIREHSQTKPYRYKTLLRSRTKRKKV